MANEMAPSTDYQGLSRKVIAYSEAFVEIVAKAKQGTLVAEDWTSLEQLVDVASFERIGVFLGPKAEVIDWATYKHYLSQFAGGVRWEGTLRHVTEQGDRVILEMEERNTRAGRTDISNTVTIYEFSAAGLLRHLDVYVMPLDDVPE